MAIELEPTRFIPFRKTDIIAMCLQRGELDADRAARFRDFTKILQHVFHYEFHGLQEALKDAYEPINPDADTRDIAGTDHGSEAFFDLLETLLDKANYQRVDDEDLAEALREESLFKIRLQVDFSDFSEVLLFRRGQSVRTETLSSLFGLYRREITFTNYDRVVVYLKFRDDYRRSRDQLPAVRPGATLLKLFRNVPKADMEMLFPNTEIRMRLMDKLLIGIPAAVSGGIVVMTKLGTTLVLMGSLIGYWVGLHQQPVELNKAAAIALLAGFGALGAYLWKQISNFRNRRLRFIEALTRNLYFKNLDNGAGVFYRLLNDAEEEECKEAILAWYFLLISPKPLSKSEIDTAIENWLAEDWNAHIDFEVDDALNKLVRLQLVEAQGGRYCVVGIDQAIRRLDDQWDNYYTNA